MITGPRLHWTRQLGVDRDSGNRQSLSPPSRPRSVRGVEPGARRPDASPCGAGTDRGSGDQGTD